MDRIGPKRFEEAKQWAWATAAGTGAARTVDEVRAWSPFVTNVPHDLESLVWDEGDSAPAERVRLFWALYRELPCYANLMYAKSHLREWDGETRRAFWHDYRAVVNDPDDRLADPAMYALWCDYFEDVDSVDEAWSEIAQPDVLNERGLERVLSVAGPVPFHLKQPLYERLAADGRWHPHIFRSLFHSAFDYYGDVDIAAARELLRRLDIPRETEGLRELEERLS